MWLKRFQGIGWPKVSFFTTPARQLHVRKNKTPLGDYYGAVLYENGRHIHTIGMENYDQERINDLRKAWTEHGTYTR